MQLTLIYCTFTVDSTFLFSLFVSLLCNFFNCARFFYFYFFYLGYSRWCRSTRNTGSSRAVCKCAFKPCADNHESQVSTSEYCNRNLLMTLSMTGTLYFTFATWCIINASLYLPILIISYFTCCFPHSNLFINFNWILYFIVCLGFTYFRCWN